jgi:hypothetical protein
MPASTARPAATFAEETGSVGEGAERGGIWSLDPRTRAASLRHGPPLHPLSPDSVGKKGVREIEKVSYGRRALMGGKPLAQVGNGVDRPG